MLFVGYFEGIESERGLEWRCADSLSLRTCLGGQVSERVPDPSSLSRVRSRLDGKVYDEVFRLVLGIMESRAYCGARSRASIRRTLRAADASMKSIVRKDTGDDYTSYLKKLCEAQGIANPTVEDARRMDRKRKGKKVSNRDWQSPTDVDARLVRLKDGRTRLGYKAEHVVDLDTGAIVAAEVYSADQADTATLRPSLETARDNMDAARAESTHDDESDGDDDAPPPAAPTGEPRQTIEVVADKGYHKVELLLELGRAEYRTYIPVPEQKGQRRFTDKGRMLAREAFHHNRARVRRNKGKKLLRLRGERIERTFALACETGAHRRVRLRGRDNVRKRYLAHLAALNLGLVMRTLFGHGTPRQAADAVLAALSAALRAGLQIAIRKMVPFAGRFFGTILPPERPRIVATPDLAA